MAIPGRPYRIDGACNLEKPHRLHQRKGESIWAAGNNVPAIPWALAKTNSRIDDRRPPELLHRSTGGVTVPIDRYFYVGR